MLQALETIPGGRWIYATNPDPRVNYSEQVNGTQMGQVFDLREKVSVSGEIVSEATGLPMGKVTVEAYPVEVYISDDTNKFSIPRLNNTESDIDGLFEMNLDKGQYNILLKPDPSSFYPWFWLNNITVSEDIEDWDIEIPDPVKCERKIVDSEGMPFGHARVEIYEIKFIPGTGEPPYIRHIGETSTRAIDGSFTAFIAP